MGLIGLIGLISPVCAEEQADSIEGWQFTTIDSVGITPVKDQNRSGTCWCFSTIGFLESEILRTKGIELDLSEMFVVSKTMIDRANSLYPREYKFRDVYLLSVAADDGDYVDEKAAGGVQGWVDCFEKAEFKGKVFAGNVNDRGDIEGHKALDEAYKMGKDV